MSRPSVLFVGTRRSSAEVNSAVFAAREEGYDVALLAPAAPSFSSSLLSDLEIVDLFDRPRALAAGLDLARRASVRGVLTWMDTGVELLAGITAELGLLGPTPEAARRARNKHEMRAALASRPDLIPRFQLVRSLEELTAAVAEIGFPAVLKPAGGNGSKGILQVDEETDLSRLWEVARAVTTPEVDPIFGDYEGQHVYEERLGGSEHSVEGFVRDGEVLVAGITDKWVTPDYYLEYEEVYPSVVPPGARQRMIDLAHGVVEAVGLNNCPFHLECRLLPDGSAKLLEIAARPGGGYITSHLIPLSTGLDFHRNCVRLATGRELDMRAPGMLYAGRRAFLAETGGRLEAIEGLDEVLAVWGVEHMSVERPVGSTVVLPPEQSLSSQLVNVIGRSPDYDEVRELIGRSLGHLRVEVVANGAVGAGSA